MDDPSSSVGAIFFVIVLIAAGVWYYNHTSTETIETDYGYNVETSPLTQKPDCTSLEPNNPYGAGSGHYAGYEWGQSGHDCGGNSTSFIEGCQEYQQQESAYEYCLSR